MVRADLRADRDQERRAPHPGAIAIAQHLRRRRIACLGSLGETFAPGQPFVAADQHEAPGPKPPMVGRAQAGIEDQVELGALRRRLLQHADRLPAEQQPEGPHAAFPIVHFGDVIHGQNIEPAWPLCK